MPSARLRRPIDYFHSPLQFGHRTPGGPPGAGVSLTWPTKGAARLLRAAILQHCVVITAMEAVLHHPRRTSIRKIADGGRVEISHLRMTLRGQAFMHMAEVATLASVAPNALPNPVWIHDAIISSTVRMQPQIIASGTGIPGMLGLMSSEEIAQRDMLAALAGWVVVEHSPSEVAAQERLADRAGSLLEENAREQARAAGLPLYPRRRHDAVTVRLAHPTYAPVEVGGCWDPAGPILAANLPGDWIEAVRDPGWAIIDGHFIAEIVAARGGRPETVRAVRLYPERPEDPDTEWLYNADLATVSGSGDRPTLTFSEPRRPRW